MIIVRKGFPSMNVVIDTNVVLDFLLGREPFVTQSAKVMFLSEKSVFD
jgi:predicted nucleic acid-binding protein